VDYAISGATALRPGYQALLSDARLGVFDIVVAESLDRFSRDQEHIAAFFKLMSFAGIAIATLAEGVITELHIGLKGTMSALYLKGLAKKTHRGLEPFRRRSSHE
jgi:site-specific DNA recombinase